MKKLILYVLYYLQSYRFFYQNTASLGNGKGNVFNFQLISKLECTTAQFSFPALFI
jgi:hypothetical protein